jgi:Commissureless
LKIFINNFLFFHFTVYDAQLANQQRAVHLEQGSSPYDIESLPSYTLVSGLPSYDAAIEQLKTSKSSSQPAKVHRPSIIKLFNFENEREEQKYRFTISSATLDGAEEPVPAYAEALKLSVKVPADDPGSHARISSKLLASVPSYEEALYQFQQHQKIPLLGENRSHSVDGSASYTEHPVPRYCPHHSKLLRDDESSGSGRTNC